MASPEQLSIATAEGFGLQLSSGLANELAHRIAGAANALPKRGLEVCGFLLGERCANVFVVTSLFPISCRYAEGPAFRTSEGELSDALQRMQPLSRVIGFYRSRNDGSLDLDSQDRLLLDRLAGRPLLALLIRQQKNSAGEGRMLVWDGNNLVASVGEIFSTEQWMTTARPKSKDLKPPSPPALEMALLPIPEPPLEQTGTDQQSGNERVAWIAAVAFAFALLLFVAWRIQYVPFAGTGALPSEAGRAIPPPLVIVPGRGPSQAGAASSDPAGGLGQDAKVLRSLKLWIRDRDDIVLREFAVRELARRGKEDPETLPLLVETAQSDSSEVVRVAAVETIAGGWEMKSSTRDFFEERARIDSSLAVRQTAERILANATKPSGGVNESRAAVSDNKKASPPKVNKPVAKQSKLAKSEAGSGTAPQQPQAAPRFRPPTAAKSAPQTPKLPLPVPNEVARTKPERPSFNVPAPDIPSRPRSVPDVISPPAAVRQTPAVVIPPDFRRLVRGEALISVRVAIDAKGQVSTIYPSEETGNLERSLWGFCSRAVRLWAFKPARRNNEAIPGELILNFRVTSNPYH